MASAKSTKLAEYNIVMTRSEGVFCMLDCWLSHHFALPYFLFMSARQRFRSYSIPDSQQPVLCSHSIVLGCCSDGRNNMCMTQGDGRNIADSASDVCC
jgi:hypothetical protein